MPGQIRATFWRILGRIRAKIAADTGLDVALVIPIIRRRQSIPHLTGNQDVLLRSRGFANDQGYWDGGGRYQTLLRRRLEVTCRTRFAIDVVGSAEQFLLNETAGHLQFEDTVFASLAGFEPTYSDDNPSVLTVEAIRPESSTDPEEDEKQKDSTQDRGSSSLIFIVSYFHDFG